MEKILIIGGGIAGLAAGDNIRKINKDAEITIITSEAFMPYSRIKLSKYLYKEFNVEELYLHKQQWYEDNRINVMLSTEVKAISPSERSITTDKGEKLQYTKLIIANGSHGFVPPIQGSSLKGVFTVRTMADVLAIQSYIKEKNVKNIAVIGGGLLGIETAWAFKESNKAFNINIIEAMPGLLPRQLDYEGSRILEDTVWENGIRLYLNSGVISIEGQNEVSHIALKDGSSLDAEMVIISAGVRSNVDIAKNCGINVNRAVVVDSHMKTSIEDIYAAGDICEYNGMMWGLWSVAIEQGRIAGINAAGGDEEYKEISPSSLLQVMDMSIFSTGDISVKGLDEVKYDGNTYTKLFFEKGVIRGAILIGNTKKGFSLKKAIEEKRDFSMELSKGMNILEVI